MSGQFTDRDERMWQQRAEEPAARPLPIGAWLRGLRAAIGGGEAAHSTTGRGAVARAARPRGYEPA
ncbi:hypothetical protein [Streptomyces sp. NBC_00094]|uniref:hypothetical protein n=1 Tax=Streptomyces sp. NBC_00094 TaxID=2903620 RepID=UPI002250DD5E|nr:hypothetical protein [Streptomyces sp. NBC_00094]MCX5388792.1 hypothetical protein [Streptomyces sp. NBC_00094]